MKYFIIAGEASGDLHAANLIRAISAHEAGSSFYAYGGELMEAAGAQMLCYYRDIAYMGFLNVALHAGTILRAMARCKKEIASLKPDVVILVDYPGFNLEIAKYVKTHTDIPVYYYISPKVWAWREGRVKALRAYVDEIFSILPFEVDWFKRRGLDVHYVGNPTVDEVEDFRRTDYAGEQEAFARQNGIDTSGKVIALLAGSRRQEISRNLRRMCLAAEPFTRKGYQLVVAGAPETDDEIYFRNIPENMLRSGKVKLVSSKTYALLSIAWAALVTSGTATLETALFRVPQAVCYYIPLGGIVSKVREYMLKVKYISLVNLIAGREVVKEFVADGMSVRNVGGELRKIVEDDDCRKKMLAGYDEVSAKLGGTGAAAKAASEMLFCLQRRMQGE